MDWDGFLLPLLLKLFPWMPEPVALTLIGLIISVLTSLWKPKAPVVTVAEQRHGGREPRPLVVAVPAAVGTLLAGPWGVIAPAVGDGVRRAAWTLIRWIAQKTGVMKESQ